MPRAAPEQLTLGTLLSRKTGVMFNFGGVWYKLEGAKTLVTVGKYSNYSFLMKGTLLTFFIHCCISPYGSGRSQLLGGHYRALIRRSFSFDFCHGSFSSSWPHWRSTSGCSSLWTHLIHWWVFLEGLDCGSWHSRSGIWQGPKQISTSWSSSLDLGSDFLRVPSCSGFAVCRN